MPIYYFIYTTNKFLDLGSNNFNNNYTYIPTYILDENAETYGILKNSKLVHITSTFGIHAYLNATIILTN